MNNNQFEKLYKLLKVRKSNSGFTLLELLSGLMMSTIVIVGLSYGLVQLTRATRDETNKVTARNESSRAIEFISDEVRRAQSIEIHDPVTGNLANLGTVAPTYNPPNDGGANEGIPRLALQIPGVAERVIYSVAEPVAGSPWKGPLVIYRWGPAFNGNGEYSSDGFNDDGSINQSEIDGWDNLALIEGVNDDNQIETCGSNNITYQGFFACVTDDDNDGVAEVETTDIDGNGVIDDDDVDGLAITAQLYFSSDIDIANTDYDQEYTAETQVVARARVRNTNAEQDDADDPIRFKTLGAEYSLHTRANAEGPDPTECNGKKTWTMRTDFINGNNLTTWIHDDDRQGQQINVDPSNKLQIASIPIGNGSCSGDPISRGNKDKTKDSDIYTNPGNGAPWTYDSSTVQLSEFTIDFDDYKTFNGNDKDDPNDPTNYNEPNIPGIEHVKIYKQGSIISDVNDLLGYDDNTTDGFDAEDSLGEFLRKKGYAIIENGKYRIVKKGDTQVPGDPELVFLDHTERIIAVEIGQVQNDGTSLLTIGANPNPGFDIQDSVMLFSMDKFEENHTGSSSP